MAEATSLTSETIQELMAGWEAVAARQEDLNAEIAELKGKVETYQLLLTEFTEFTLPEVEALVAANAIETSDLKDNAVPNLESDVASHDLALANINVVDIPNLQEQINENYGTIAEIPQTFTQPEPPEDLDPDYPILIGAKWFDEDDLLKEYHWTGTEWIPSNIEIPDLSITVQKFKTSTHLIY